MIEAFEATLQEANDANLLLHVVDCASPVLAEQMAEVQRVLVEIGASGIAQVLVFNKLDRLEETQRPRLLRDTLEMEAGVRVPRVFISAHTGEGMDELRAIVSEAIAAEHNCDLNFSDVSPPPNAAPFDPDSKPLPESGAELETDPAAGSTDDL